MREHRIRDKNREHQPSNATINNSSTIANQVGVVHGDQNIYQVSREASPEEKFIRGRNCLDGRMTRQAEAHIREAIAEGYRSAQVSYYWTLSILSGKCFNHLKEEEFRKLDHAFEGITRHPADEWTAPLKFLAKLVAYLRSQGDRGGPNLAEWTSIIDTYSSLKASRQTEIQRHIELMTEAVQSNTEFLNKVDADKKRMQNKRQRRAWKFFEPDPKKPNKRSVQRPQISSHDWVRVGMGALLGLVGIGWEVLLTFGRTPMYGSLAIVTIGASSYAVAQRSLEQFAFRYCQITNKRERLTFLRDSGMMGPAGSDSPAQNAQFAASIAPLITYYFRKFCPEEFDQSEWEKSTLDIRRDLQFQLAKLYGPSDVDPGRLKWLIRWHAIETQKGWESHKAAASRRQRPPNSRQIVRGAGLTALILSTLVILAISASVDLGDALLAALLTAVGCGITLRSAMHIYGERKRYALEKKSHAALYRAEIEEYQRWVGRLRDRPDDLEMARWLDYDKAHIKSLAMDKHQVTGRDIVAHATMTESNPQRKHARVPLGPYRYSKYEVHVFLLTEGGVRQMSVDLNFQTGELSNFRRKIFPYDSIASAGIVEVEARFYGRQRTVKTSDDPAEIQSEKKPSSVVITQALRLSLVDGEEIDILFEGFNEAALNPLNDTEDLRERSQDASGTTDALRILEAVATEGKEWLERERTRRHRRLADFSPEHATKDAVKHRESDTETRRRNHKKPSTHLAVGRGRSHRKQLGKKTS